MLCKYVHLLLKRPANFDSYNLLDKW